MRSVVRWKVKEMRPTHTHLMPDFVRQCLRFQWFGITKGNNPIGGVKVLRLKENICHFWGTVCMVYCSCSFANCTVLPSIFNRQIYSSNLHWKNIALLWYHRISSAFSLASAFPVQFYSSHTTTSPPEFRFETVLMKAMCFKDAVCSS